MRRSLRFSLIVGTCLAATVILALADVALFLLIRQGIIAYFDRSLTDKAKVIATAVEQDRKGLDLGFEDVDMAEFSAAAHGGFLQVWDSDGKTLYRSPSLGGASLTAPAAGGQAERAAWMSLQSAAPARAVSFRFAPRIDLDNDDNGHDSGGNGQEDSGEQPPLLSLTLARDAGPIADTLRPILWAMITIGLLAVAGTCLVLWLVVSRALHSVGAVAAQIERIGGDSLGARIEGSSLPKELQPIVLRFNELLDRVSAALQREKRLSADLAHELRTPLAGLRTTLEVALSRTREADAYQEALSDCLPVVSQMQGMAESLLLLARLESGQVEVDKQSVSLRGLLQSTWAPLDRLASQKELRVQWLGEEDIAVQADPRLLAMATRNILENAVAYTPAGGTLTIETRREGSTAVVTVRNTTTMRPEDSPHVFDRYWRADGARSDAGVHCGLGLSLVKSIAEVMGDNVTAVVRPDGIFELNLHLSA
ncbi:MAG: hypothetical protein GWP05_08475 [Anaerolineaceae bacterium]|nr:hypothetical protein [Anaerolineaceae bacterium]